VPAAAGADALRAGVPEAAEALRTAWETRDRDRVREPLAIPIER